MIKCFFHIFFSIHKNFSRILQKENKEMRSKKVKKQKYGCELYRNLSGEERK